MTKINLLPWREENRKQQLKEFVIIAGGSVVIVLLLCILVHTIFARMISNQAHVNDFFREKITVLDQQIQEVRTIKEKKNELINRMQIVQNLQTNRTEIVQMFNEFVRTLPNGVYITALEKKGTQITVKGKAESNTRISEFMKSLDKSEAFMDPQLTEIKSDDKDEPDVRTFELQMTMQPLNQPESANESE